MNEKVVLAYSGGLDTTVAVARLKEERGLDVIALSIDIGQNEDLDAIRDRALKCGAADAVVIDAVDEFASDFVAPALAANAMYQGKYPLVSALSRPLIAKHLAATARANGAQFVAHGCTGKGNDQVRFEVSLGALAPEVAVIAPIRDWAMRRDEAVRYALDRGLELSSGPRSPYSIDQNLWGRTVECGELEDPMVEAPEDVWERTSDPASAPPPRYVEIDFENGVPIAVDGVHMELPDLIRTLDEYAGSYGIGRIDMIEDRVVGIKSREIYEVPGASTLISAHIDLEELTLERELLRQKRRLEQRYAELVYEGLWYSPLREALDAFNASASEQISGMVRMKLEPGNARPVGRRAEDSLYETALATYEEGDEFDHKAAAGFVKLWGLPLKIWARRGKQ